MDIKNIAYDSFRSFLEIVWDKKDRMEKNEPSTFNNCDAFKKKKADC